MMKLHEWTENAPKTKKTTPTKMINTHQRKRIKLNLSCSSPSTQKPKTRKIYTQQKKMYESIMRFSGITEIREWGAENHEEDGNPPGFLLWKLHSDAEETPKCSKKNIGFTRCMCVCETCVVLLTLSLSLSLSIYLSISCIKIRAPVSFWNTLLSPTRGIYVFYTVFFLYTVEMIFLLCNPNLRIHPFNGNKFIWWQQRKWFAVNSFFFAFETSSLNQNPKIQKQNGKY